MSLFFSYLKSANMRFRHMVTAVLATAILTLCMTSSAAAVTQTADANGGDRSHRTTVEVALSEIKQIEIEEGLTGSPASANAGEVTVIQDEQVPLAGTITESPNFVMIWMVFLLLVTAAGLITYGLCVRKKE